MSIDQSISCSGITIWDDGGCTAMSCIKTHPGLEVIIRLRDIIKELDELVVLNNVDLIVIEQMAYGAQSTSVRMLAALYYFIENLCVDRGIDFEAVSITKVKKFVTGKGNAKKTDMIEATPQVFLDECLELGYKKTTGLADLVDSRGIYKTWEASC